MAESVGGLYLRLGLNLSELETGFVNASQTVAANIARLNRESNLIRIRSEVEIAGLDETADAARILQVRQEALNRQMEIQRDRVRILNTELQDLAQTQGENSVAAQRAALRVERERLALTRLEREVREVTAAISELNSTDINVGGTASISGGANGGSGGGSGGWSDLLPIELPTTKIAAFGLAVGALGAAVAKTTEVFKESLEGFRETQKQSYELNLDFNDTEQLLRELRLAGGDIGDFEGYIRGITDAYVKGEYDDPEFIALRKYGAEITDETGRLKDFKEITEEVYQAWKKADEAGEGIEFLQLTGGESGIRDAIQLFKRFEEAKEDAAKIVDGNLDNEQWHELERSINLATEQADEFKDAISNIFTPVAQSAAEKIFNVFRDGTELLIESKDAIQEFGFITSAVLEEVAPKIENLFPSGQFKTALESFNQILPDLNRGDEKAIENFYNDSFINHVGDLFNDTFIARAIERGKESFREFNGELEESKTVSGKVAQGLAALSDAQKENGDVLSQYGTQRVKQFKDELEDLKIEMQFGDNDYLKSLAQLDLWKERELTDKLQVSVAEREAILELYSAKSKQIEQERADKISEIRKSVDAEFKSSLENQIDKINELKEQWIKAGMDEAEATELAQKKIVKAYEEANAKVQERLKNAADIEYELTHTAFEKQLRDIEQWEKAQRDKAETAEEIAAIIAESAAKEAQAFEKEVERIKSLTQSLEDEIFEMEHSQYEADIRRAMQKYQNYLSQGGIKEIADRWLSDKLNQFNVKAKGSEEYKKPPEGSMQRAGNGIVVIEGDQIIDDGLIKGQQQEIALLADENQIRAQLMSRLSREGQEKVASIQSTRNLTDAQRNLVQATEQAASGFQLIEGDQVINQPSEGLHRVGNGIVVIEGDQIVDDGVINEPLKDFSTAVQETTAQLNQPIETTALQDFDSAVQSTASTLEQLNQPASDLQNFSQQLESALPVDYFKTLADGAKAVSQMQQLQTESTLKLLEAQDRYANALKNLPSNNQQKQQDGLINLSTPKQATEIPRTINQSQESGFKFPSKVGFDTDVFISQIDLSEIITPLNSIDEKVQSVLEEMKSEEPESDFDFSELFTPLDSISESTQSILQAIKDEQPQDNDRLQELLGDLPNIAADVQSLLQELQAQTPEENQIDYLTPLNNIDSKVQSILEAMKITELENTTPTPETQIDYLTPLNNIDTKLQSVLTELQTPKETAMTFETIVTPLNTIAQTVGSILTPVGNKQPPQITVSPNNNINLGGAYVFDNALKQELVNDITSQIVDKITSAVQSATSRSSYGYGA